MGLFGKKKKVASELSSQVVPRDGLFGVMASLGQALQAKSISYSIQNKDPIETTYRGEELRPYLIIETTQFFTNKASGMTWLNKQWRANPYEAGGLGNIDISASDSYEISMSSLFPSGPISDESIRERTKQRIKALVAQSQRGMSDIQCGEFSCIPYIILSCEFIDPSKGSVDELFGEIQLFALEVHRIFSSIRIQM